MSLMGTLAKVAIGIIVAKSVGGMLKGGRGGGGSIGGGGGAPGRERGGPWSGGRDTGGGLFPPAGRETGLEDMMGDIFSKSPAGRQPAPRREPAPQDPFGPGSGPVVAEEPGAPQGGPGGGLGDLLEQLGGKRGGAQTGRIDDVLGGQGGGLGDILGGILAGSRGASGRGGSFGEVLNDAFNRRGEPELAPTREQEAAAALMLRAMIQAAKSDGRIDQAEQKKITDNLGQATPEEMEFVRAELRAPIDIDRLCRQVPQGLAPQVYAMSLMAIDLDNRTEAQYLHDLAAGLGLGRADVNGIHAQLGVQPLYS